VLPRASVPHLLSVGELTLLDGLSVTLMSSLQMSSRVDASLDFVTPRYAGQVQVIIVDEGGETSLASQRGITTGSEDSMRLPLAAHGETLGWLYLRGIGAAALHLVAFSQPAWAIGMVQSERLIGGDL